MHLKTSSIKGFLIIGLLAGLTTFSLIAPCFAHEPIRTVNGKVTKVSDGDTIQVTTPEQTKLRVRLYGIDAPETPKINQRTGRVNKPGQPYGEESWKALEGKIMGKQIRLDIIDIDQYKRMVGMIWIGDRNINLEMVQEGYAEAYLEYLKEPYRAQ
jgi:micrococcal nuclease